MSRLKGPVLEASTVAQVGEDEKTKQIEENWSLSGVWPFQLPS
jgi:hypothetical protein